MLPQWLIFQNHIQFKGATSLGAVGSAEDSQKIRTEVHDLQDEVSEWLSTSINYLTTLLIYSNQLQYKDHRMYCLYHLDTQTIKTLQSTVYYLIICIYHQIICTYYLTMCIDHLSICIPYNQLHKPSNLLYSTCRSLYSPLSTF